MKLRSQFPLLIALLLALMPVIGSATPAVAFSPQPGLEAAELSGTDITNGSSISLEDYRGKWVMLPFIAGWHELAMSKLDEMQAIHENSAGDDYAVVAVSKDDASQFPRMLERISELGLAFPVIHGLRGEEADDFGWTVPLLPTTIIIDPTGTITYVQAGTRDLRWALDFFRQKSLTEEKFDLKLLPVLQADGSLEVLVGVVSPDRVGIGLDLTIQRTYGGEHPETDATGQPNYELPGFRAADTLSFPLAFRFKDGSREARRVSVPAEFVSQAIDVSISASYVIPGSARSKEFHESGLHMSKRLELAGHIADPNLDGFTTVYPPLPGQEEIKAFMDAFSPVLTDWTEPFVPVPGAVVPELSGAELHSGQSISLSSYRGEWVLLAFIAGWCSPSKQMLGEIHRAHLDGEDKGYKVIAVNISDANFLPDLEDEIAYNSYSFPLISELLAYRSDTFGWTFQFVPKFVLIDPDGIIRDTAYGLTDLSAFIGRAGISQQTPIKSVDAKI